MRLCLLLIFGFFILALITKTSHAAALCTTSPTSGSPGSTISITTTPGGAFGDINIQPAFGGTVTRVGFLATAPGPATFTIPSVTPGLYAVRVGTLGASCDDLSITSSSGGGGGAAGLGTIDPPGTIPTVGGDPSGFVAGIIRGGVQFLIIIAFILAFLWTIFAGLRFITAGGDEKTVASSWSQIYWGLIGLVVVVGAFAIIRLVENFFNVYILTGFQLPTR